MKKQKVAQNKSIKDLRKDISLMRLEKHAGKLKNLKAIFTTRKEVARLLTVENMAKIKKTN